MRLRPRSSFRFSNASAQESKSSRLPSSDGLTGELEIPPHRHKIISGGQTVKPSFFELYICRISLASLPPFDDTRAIRCHRRSRSPRSAL